MKYKSLVALCMFLVGVLVLVGCAPKQDAVPASDVAVESPEAEVEAPADLEEAETGLLSEADSDETAGEEEDNAALAGQAIHGNEVWSYMLPQEDDKRVSGVRPIRVANLKMRPGQSGCWSTQCVNIRGYCFYKGIIPDSRPGVAGRYLCDDDTNIWDANRMGTGDSSDTSSTTSDSSSSSDSTRSDSPSRGISERMGDLEDTIPSIPRTVTVLGVTYTAQDGKWVPQDELDDCEVSGQIRSVAYSFMLPQEQNTFNAHVFGSNVNLPRRIACCPSDYCRNLRGDCKAPGLSTNNRYVCDGSKWYDCSVKRSSFDQDFMVDGDNYQCSTSGRFVKI